ncbi:MAG: T9SS type A sorting domain-containing protein [Draconibacterium sp.]|nr:T9SS type A sorting domain-containing protein [Draconibacterium sp.]
MKWTLISFLCIVAISNAVGQNKVFENEVKGETSVNIALDEVNKSFTPPPSSFLKSGQKKKSEIIITYVNFPEEAKLAFEYAASIYEQNISSSVPIVISATWESLEGNILAQGGAASFHKDFVDAIIPEVFYPITLVEKLSGKEYNNEKDADIICSFDSKRSWYFGTDGNTPQSKYDFVTVVLHEITHGLGMSGFLKVESGVGKISTPGKNPSIYDYYIFNAKNQRIADNSQFTSPSIQLLQQLISNNLDFTCVDNCNSSKAEIYAPTNWSDGASIYHLKNSNSNGARELMGSSIRKGEAIHNPGENTFRILSEIGWDAVPFKLREIKDYEVPVAELPIQTKITSNSEFNYSEVQIIFSTNSFSTKDSVTLKYNGSNKLFEGNIPLDFYKGKVKYYFKSVTTDNKVMTYPFQAPKKSLNFKVGPDYYSPQLQHNPTKIISSKNSEIHFMVTATDNLGINAVTIEYKINNVMQETFKLACETDDIYCGNLNLPINLTSDDIIEYRIIARDNSTRNNIKYLPAKGFYEVHVFESQEAVTSFSTDFNSVSNNFTTTDFEVATPVGFTNGNLHTNHPYQQSKTNNEKYNLIAQLNVPIVLMENGLMTFDEIVLVEPGDAGANYTEKYFWDFVIVEGSKDNGKTWQPFIDGYDSGVNEDWKSQFSGTLKSSTSSAVGHENMFWENSINLTDNDFFSAGDTAIIRFRLASDKSVTGWGWAIDNLNIQMLNTDIDETATNSDITIYPNPFSNSLFIDCSNLTNSSEIVVQITDLVGKTVYHEIKYDSQYNPKLQVNLPDVKPGIYIASITDADLNTITQKIIKN